MCIKTNIGMEIGESISNPRRVCCVHFRTIYPCALKRYESVYSPSSYVLVSRAFPSWMATNLREEKGNSVFRGETGTGNHFTMISKK